jgi:hypothetical protein
MVLGLSSQALTATGIALDLIGAIGLFLFAHPLRALGDAEKAKLATRIRVSWAFVVVGFAFQMVGTLA